MDEQRLRRVLEQDVEVPDMINRKLEQTYARLESGQRPAKRRGARPVRVMLIAAAAVALLVTTVAAATVPGLSQRLLAYLGVKPEDAHAAELLAPGGVSVDVTAEDNGMVLHVTQILRESRSMVVLADFIGPEGTALDYTEEDQLRSMLSSVLPPFSQGAELLDKDGRRIACDVSGGWSVVDDEDLEDNHLTLLFRLEFDPDSPHMREAASLRLPSPQLYRFDKGGLEPVYSGDWSCMVPVPQADTRWTLKPGHAAGELDGAAITVEELSLSPATLSVTLKRDRPATVAIDPTGAVIDPEEEAVFERWAALGENMEGIALTTKDGRIIPVQGYTHSLYEEEQRWSYRLAEATDPAQFQGGTLTLDWACGRITIPLDNLAPAK